MDENHSLANHNRM